MSEMEHKKVKLKAVDLGGRGLQDWIYMEYSMFFDEDYPANVLCEELNRFYESEDLTCPYYLFKDTLFKVSEERDIDPYGFVEATFVDCDTIQVDAMWYNGGGALSEVIVEGLGKLEKENKYDISL